MNKEERAELRAQYNDYTAYECAIHGGTGVSGTGHEKGHHDFLEWLADGGFPYLLDELEGALSSLEEYKNTYYEKLEQVIGMADRDHWKARAEALEAELAGYRE